jgi:hypothetical protein
LAMSVLTAIAHACLALGLSARWGELLKLALEVVEVDRFGDKLGGSVLAGPATTLVVAVGRDHDHR